MSLPNKCGHTNRPRFAKGLCRKCYDAAYYAVPQNRIRQDAYHAAWRARPENRIKKNIRNATWYAKPENKAKSIIRSAAWYANPGNRIKRAAWRAKPENRAKLYAHKTGCNYEDVLAYMTIPNLDRICLFCEKTGPVLVLDHDHETLVVRGWAHQLCNTIEGLVSKSPDPDCILNYLICARRIAKLADKQVNEAVRSPQSPI